MAFPVSPTNGQTATVNNITYVYNSTHGSWTRTTSTVTALSITDTGDVSANVGNATVNIATLFSNAATQATTLNTINANLGTATTNINTLFGAKQ